MASGRTRLPDALTEPENRTEKHESRDKRSAAWVVEREIAALRLGNSAIKRVDKFPLFFK